MNDAGLLLAIFLISLTLGFIMRFLVSNVINSAEKFKKVLNNKKQFQKKQKELEQMRDRGEQHDWVTIEAGDGPMLVCKKTGYAPRLKGFVPVEAVNTYLLWAEREEEYKLFRNARVTSLARELGLSETKMEEVVEKIFAMKKDFTLLQLDKLKQELQENKENAKV